MRDHILIETNCFTNPVPFELKSIQSYVGGFLENTGEATLVTEYGLQPFHLQVLSLERTFFEKVLSLVNASYDGMPALAQRHRLNAAAALTDSIKRGLPATEEDLARARLYA